MSVLFVDACLRKESRTRRLANKWLERQEGQVTRLPLAELDINPLDSGGPNTIAAYSQSVADADYSHPMFELAKDFARYDEIVIAAPFWNYSIPAKLHCYLELMCSQGLTFDINEQGGYVSLVKARKLTFITTAGGAPVAPEDDHAFGFIRTLAERFWYIPQVDCIAAWGLDGPGADVDALLEQALA